MLATLRLSTIIKLFSIAVLLASFTITFSLQEEQEKLPVISGIGGDFTAVAGNGQTVNFSEVKIHVLRTWF